MFRLLSVIAVTMSAYVGPVGSVNAAIEATAIDAAVHPTVIRDNACDQGCHEMTNSQGGHVTFFCYPDNEGDQCLASITQCQIRVSGSCGGVLPGGGGEDVFAQIVTEDGLELGVARLCSADGKMVGFAQSGYLHARQWAALDAVDPVSLKAE